MDNQAIQGIKQRFGIIGNHYGLNRAIDIARQVAPTDLSVLVTGPSGSGKEIFPQIIHHFSARKHGNYIPVNCGAIPEGTIDSELFGHEKGSFTGAHESRKGYFEVADGGTIFLDEIAELPLSTQVRLLRVLETGEYIRVGSSKPQKTNVRVIAATNVDLIKAIQDGKFREDLYYRLNTVPIWVPALKDRKEDVYLLFRKFASDFAQRYHMPTITLSAEAVDMIEKYDWPGNIRQLKNITEQISILEKTREINAEIIQHYLPDYTDVRLPALYQKGSGDNSFASEREILYKVLFEMKSDMNDLKKLVFQYIKDDTSNQQSDKDLLIRKVFNEMEPKGSKPKDFEYSRPTPSDHIEDTEEVTEESLSLEEKEIEMIRKSLERNGGKRKLAAEELGISERTLYRKIKEYDLNE